MRAQCTCGYAMEVDRQHPPTAVDCPQCGKHWKVRPHRHDAHQASPTAEARSTRTSLDPDPVTEEQAANAAGDGSTELQWTAGFQRLSGWTAKDCRFSLFPDRMDVHDPDGDWSLPRREAVILTRANPPMRSLKVKHPARGKMRLFAPLNAAGCWEAAGLFAWLEGLDPRREAGDVRKLALVGAMGAPIRLLLLQLAVTFPVFLCTLMMPPRLIYFFMLGVGLPLVLGVAALIACILHKPWGCLLAAVITWWAVLESSVGLLASAWFGVAALVIVLALRLVVMTLLASCYTRGFLASRGVAGGNAPQADPPLVGWRRPGLPESVFGLSAALLILAAWLGGTWQRAAELRLRREVAAAKKSAPRRSEPQVDGLSFQPGENLPHDFGQSPNTTAPPVDLRGGRIIPYWITIADLRIDDGTSLTASALHLLRRVRTVSSTRSAPSRPTCCNCG